MSLSSVCLVEHGASEYETVRFDMREIASLFFINLESVQKFFLSTKVCGIFKRIFAN